MMLLYREEETENNKEQHEIPVLWILVSPKA